MLSSTMQPGWSHSHLQIGGISKPRITQAINFQLNSFIENSGIQKQLGRHCNSLLSF